MFGKLFGRGKAKRDAFGVETSTTTVGVPGSDTTTTVTTTTSERRPLGAMDLFGSPATGGSLDLGGILETVREVQEQSGGDHEAMAELLRKRFGTGAVAVDGSSGDDAGWTVMEQQQPDPIALLATLTELHEKGVVSDEQFEAQKRRLLG